MITKITTVTQVTAVLKPKPNPNPKLKPKKRTSKPNPNQLKDSTSRLRGSEGGFFVESGECVESEECVEFVGLPYFYVLAFCLKFFGSFLF